MLSVLVLATSVRLPTTPNAAGRILNAPRQGASESGLRLQEEWALRDSLALFTVGCGQHRVTFWDALITANPVLSSRSSEELRRHAARLTGETMRRPKVLRSATQAADCTWTGVVDGHSRMLNVASEGSFDATGTRFAESLTGEIYELELRESQQRLGWSSRSSCELAQLVPATTHSSAASTRASRDEHSHSMLDALHAVYLSSLVAFVLLLGGQLVAVATHDAAPASVRVSWQQEHVSEARSDISELECWLARRQVRQDANLP